MFDGVGLVRAVMPGDTVTAHCTLAEIDEERGRSVADTRAVNQHNETVAVGRHIMRWAKTLSGVGG